MTAVWVFLGGGTGAVLRWAVALTLPAPWGTGVANVVGSFLLALLAFGPLGQDRVALALLGTGLLGGFTTYSTFNLDVVRALAERDLATAGWVFGGTVLACLAGGAAGAWAGALLPK